MPEFKLNGKTYSGSTNYASAISYTEDDGSKTTVQDKISELNSNFDEQNKNIDAKIGFTWATDVFDVTANVERSYVFQNLPEHKISFPILCEVTKQMQGVVISRDIDTIGGVRMFSPVTQQIRIALIVLI